jgi:PAS domain S-box-containing protein
MNPKKTSPPGDANEEIAALIATLHQTGQRLEELTAGEVDTVADRDGRTFVLRRAQDQLRHSEAAKQAAILNALPAHIALLDTQGRIISVNEAWRQFGSPNVLHGPGQGIGLNYLEICDNARGDDTAEARQVAEGIRSVLDGGVKRFSIEYPCHSPTEQRWFLLTVTPLADDHPHGAVVMHLNITERKRAEEALARESYRNQIFLRNASDGVHILDADGNVVEVSDSFCQMLGYSREELIDANVMLWDAQWSPQELKQRIAEMLGKEGRSVFETRHRRRDGSFLDVEVAAQGLELDGKPVLFNSARDITERKRTEEEIRRYVEQLKTAFMSTVEVVTTLSEMRDPYTAGHERRVAEIAVAIGAELGFDAQRQEGLRVAGYLHDIGKITIPSEILSKPGKLTAIQFQLVRGHAQASYDVLKGVEFPWPVAEIALQHHERLDGSGYPQGLKGEAILLEARIMAVADVVEAMSSHRPYRPGLGIDQTLAEIERGRGTLYDANVADACLKLFREKGYAIPG